METAPPITPGTNPAASSQPPPGQVGNVARSLAAKHGANSALKPAPLPAARANGPGSKGGRRSFQEELSDYLKSSGYTIGPAQAPADTGIVEAPPPYLVTPEFVGEVVKTLATGIESYDVANTTRRVRVMCGDVNLAKEIGDSFSAPPGVIDTLEKAFAELARKYPAILQWGPEGAVIGCLGAWFAKRSAGNKKLLELENLIKEQAKAKATAASVSPKT